MVLEFSQFLGGKDTEIEDKNQLVNSYFLSPANLTPPTPVNVYQDIDFLDIDTPDIDGIDID